MPHGEIVPPVSKRSIHEDIIREVEETDWSVDPIEEGDGDVCASANAMNVVGMDAPNSGHDAESDDIDFDPDELECVDEDAEEERRDREDKDRKNREDRRHSERHRYDRNHRHSVHDRHRHHPYSRRDHGSRYESKTSGDVHRRSYRHDDSPRMFSKHRSSYDYERANRERARSSSHSRDRSTRDRRDGEDKDIPLDELELEEVDCYDEIGDDDSKIIDCSSSAEKSCSGVDGLNGDNLCSRVYDMSNVEDDFPDLCEDIDVDAMRRAAAATNVVLSAGECVRPDSSLPTRKIVTTCETTIRNGRDAYKMGTTTRSNRSADNSGRKDEARRRHHRYETRNERSRSRQSERRHESRERDRFPKKLIWLRDVQPSTSGQANSSEKERCDAQIISAKGPYSNGWCSVGSEEEVLTKAVNQEAKIFSNDESELTEDHLVKRRFTCDTKKSRYDRTGSVKTSSVMREDLQTDLPLPRDGVATSPADLSMKDRQRSDSCEEYDLAIKEISTSPKSRNRLCLEQKNETGWYNCRCFIVIACSLCIYVFSWTFAFHLHVSSRR
ncbi:hypothetical protein KIN20_025858 [Parelaphostrongylus tenuis]|uniref:Uncharacterized protein n=1 Tax=Parelaphostrongylus tenuis TaxID=148309 RepID=A0AAD5QUQ4_PARTN|nr:hypothetical protein KIN20_025858 [Parelaphostrongylus tenuis]